MTTATLATDRHAEMIRRVVEAAPPLTAEQSAHIRRLIKNGKAAAQ